MAKLRFTGISSSAESNEAVSETNPDNCSNNNTIKSSFPGLHRYTGRRGTFHPSVFEWLEAKRRDDNVGNFWRVHDKLYDLQNFMDKHPGGRDWIEFSQGTDITEAFESSHFVNISHVERILENYYIAEASLPRNSPYTFHKDGFYANLKQKAEPILKEVGMELSLSTTVIGDSLAFFFLVTSLVGFIMHSTTFLIVAGLVLGMLQAVAHNFFHKRDNWRKYYFDFGSLSSYEWKISHAFSHHLYPNSILDYEILVGEPIVEMLPVRPKSVLHKYILPFVIDFLYGLYGVEQVPLRFLSIYQGKQKLRPENLIVLIELGFAIIFSPSLLSGITNWATILSASTFWFGFVANNSSHHHPQCFHDGDEARPIPDFGLCQLDATASKTDWYHRSLFSVLTTFGEHPLHHLFPTVCHGKLKYLKPIVDLTLCEFSEQILQFTQWQLFVGTHQQLGRTKINAFGYKKES